MLQGKTAIVTGASRGLGRAIAKRLAADGARVALGARSLSELVTVADDIRAAGGEAMHAALDLADLQSIRAFVNEVRTTFGPIDILINNAGLGWYKPFAEHSFEELAAIMDVNLTGLVLITKAVVDDMTSRKSGHIINIASDLGRKPLANMAAYAGAKHGVMGFAGSLLRELKGEGVKVMTLTPGIIDTYFGGGEAGTREETWSLNPDVLADTVSHLLNLPQYVVIDELAIHPLHQDF